jgi:hypothetical protein
MTLWVDDWQMQCCGEAFAIGSKVSWTVRDADHEWLTDVIGPDAAATIDAAEEHHGGDDMQTVHGTVTSIAAVHCRYSPQRDGDTNVLHPVPRSATLTQLDAADGWMANHDDLRFTGYVVRLTLTVP